MDHRHRRSGSISRRTWCARSPAGGGCSSSARCSRSRSATLAAMLLARLAGIDRTTGDLRERARRRRRDVRARRALRRARRPRCRRAEPAHPDRRRWSCRSRTRARRARRRCVRARRNAMFDAAGYRAADGGDARRQCSSRSGCDVPNAFVLGLARGRHSADGACRSTCRRRRLSRRTQVSVCSDARSARASSRIFSRRAPLRRGGRGQRCWPAIALSAALRRRCLRC